MAINKLVSVAPMMGYTTPHARKLYRILSKKAFLFTEMVPSKTLIHSLKKNLFCFSKKKRSTFKKTLIRINFF